MCTYLGAASNLTPKDIDKDIIQAAKVVYMEGYLFDPPDAQDAFVEAADLAHDAGRKVSITLSDPFCVDRHRHAFQNAGRRPHGYPFRQRRRDQIALSGRRLLCGAPASARAL